MYRAYKFAHFSHEYGHLLKQYHSGCCQGNLNLEKFQVSWLAAGDGTEVADGGVWTAVSEGPVGVAGSNCLERVKGNCGDRVGIHVAAGCG